MVNMITINNNNHNKYWNQYDSVTFPQRLKVNNMLTVNSDQGLITTPANQRSQIKEKKNERLSTKHTFLTFQMVATISFLRWSFSLLAAEYVLLSAAEVDLFGSFY